MDTPAGDQHIFKVANSSATTSIPVFNRYFCVSNVTAISRKDTIPSSLPSFGKWLGGRPGGEGEADRCATARPPQSGPGNSEAIERLSLRPTPSHATPRRRSPNQQRRTRTMATTSSSSSVTMTTTMTTSTTGSSEQRVDETTTQVTTNDALATTNGVEAKDPEEDDEYVQQAVMEEVTAAEETSAVVHTEVVDDAAEVETQQTEKVTRTTKTTRMVVESDATTVQEEEGEETLAESEDSSVVDVELVSVVATSGSSVDAENLDSMDTTEELALQEDAVVESSIATETAVTTSSADTLVGSASEEATAESSAEEAEVEVASHDEAVAVSTTKETVATVTTTSEKAMETAASVDEVAVSEQAASIEVVETTEPVEMVEKTEVTVVEEIAAAEAALPVSEQMVVDSVTESAIAEVTEEIVSTVVEEAVASGVQVETAEEATINQNVSIVAEEKSEASSSSAFVQDATVEEVEASEEVEDTAAEEITAVVTETSESSEATATVETLAAEESVAESDAHAAAELESSEEKTEEVATVVATESVEAASQSIANGAEDDAQPAVDDSEATKVETAHEEEVTSLQTVTSTVIEDATVTVKETVTTSEVESATDAEVSTEEVTEKSSEVETTQTSDETPSSDANGVAAAGDTEVDEPEPAPQQHEEPNEQDTFDEHALETESAPAKTPTKFSSLISRFANKVTTKKGAHRTESAAKLGLSSPSPVKSLVRGFETHPDLSPRTHRTPSAAQLDLDGSSPVKHVVHRLETYKEEENSLESLKIRTKRDFFTEGSERSIHVSQEKEKYDTLMAQRAQEDAEARVKASPSGKKFTLKTTSIEGSPESTKTTTTTTTTTTATTNNDREAVENELPVEPKKISAMSSVKNMASRFEKKAEQSLDNLSFRTVRSFFPTEKSIRVGAEKQKYEALTEQQNQAAKEAEEKLAMRAAAIEAQKLQAESVKAEEAAAHEEAAHDEKVKHVKDLAHRFDVKSPQAEGSQPPTIVRRTSVTREERSSSISAPVMTHSTSGNHTTVDTSWRANSGEDLKVSVSTAAQEETSSEEKTLHVKDLAHRLDAKSPHSADASPLHLVRSISGNHDETMTWRRNSSTDVNVRSPAAQAEALPRHHHSVAEVERGAETSAAEAESARAANVRDIAHRFETNRTSVVSAPVRTVETFFVADEEVSIRVAAEKAKLEALEKQKVQEAQQAVERPKSTRTSVAALEKEETDEVNEAVEAVETTVVMEKEVTKITEVKKQTLADFVKTVQQLHWLSLPASTNPALTRLHTVLCNHDPLTTFALYPSGPPTPSSPGVPTDLPLPRIPSAEPPALPEAETEETQAFV